MLFPRRGSQPSCCVTTLTEEGSWRGERGEPEDEDGKKGGREGGRKG